MPAHRLAFSEAQAPIPKAQVGPEMLPRYQTPLLLVCGPRLGVRGCQAPQQRPSFPRGLVLHTGRGEAPPRTRLLKQGVPVASSPEANSALK